MVKIKLVKFQSGRFGIVREVSIFGWIISKEFLSTGGVSWFGKNHPEMIARYPSLEHAKKALDNLDLTYVWVE